MARRIPIALVLVTIMTAACERDKQPPVPQNVEAREGQPALWRDGEEIEFVGKLYPSRADAEFFIADEQGRGIHVARGSKIGDLAVGTRLKVKGKVHIVNAEKPSDYDTGQYAVMLPQTFHYLDVSDFQVLNEP